MKVKLLGLLSSVILSGCFTTDIEISKDESNIDDSKVHITVVGVRKSKWAGECLGSDIDASNMTRLFENLGYKVDSFIDKEATYDNISKSFSDGKTSELNILYYSGHGGSENFSDTGSEEDDNSDEYLCLYDTFMKDNDIWKIVKSCKGRVFLIFDCCHSETMFRVPITFEDRGIKKVIRSGKVTLRAITKDSDFAGVNMLCWSGCPDNTYSYGSSSGGMFTNTILRHFKKGYTYSILWSLIENDSKLRKAQDPRKTLIGTGFDGLVFE